MAKGRALPELRFAVNDRVQAKVGPGTGDQAWLAGTVVKLWYREANWPKHRLVPYQIQIDQGPLIFAPVDDDVVVRAFTGLLAEGKIPVTILTGFLGSGKTTLLNYILKANHGKKYAIIENEVGAVGIDNLLLQSKGYNQKSIESITLLDNGCLCCTVRDDLITAIQNIVNAAKAKAKEAGTNGRVLDGILIETTGLADPGPICKTFYGSPFVNSYCKIDGVVTVVDTVHFIEQLTRERSEGAVNESAQQVAFADKVLLNKVDAVTAENLQRTIQAVKSVNPFCPMMHCSLAKTPEDIPLNTLLSIDAFDLSKMSKEIGLDLTVCGPVDDSSNGHKGHGDDHGGHGEAGHGHDHDHDHDQGKDHEDAGNESPEDCKEDHGSGHGHGHGHGHGAQTFRHDTDIGSFVAEVTDKPLNEHKFNEFMMEVMQHSENIYRMKGVLAIQQRRSGRIVRLVLQAVHDMVDMDDNVQEWPSDQKITSQLVFIGRKLDRQKWISKFAWTGV